MPIFSTRVLTYLRCIFRLLTGMMLTLALAGCDFHTPSSQLEQIRQRGEIRVRHPLWSPTSYYQRDDVAQGLRLSNWRSSTPTGWGQADHSACLQHRRAGRAAAKRASWIWPPPPSSVTPERRKAVSASAPASPGLPQAGLSQQLPRPGSRRHQGHHSGAWPAPPVRISMKELASQQYNPELAYQPGRRRGGELLKQVAGRRGGLRWCRDTILARTQRYYPELTEGWDPRQQTDRGLGHDPSCPMTASTPASSTSSASASPDGSIAKLDEKYFPATCRTSISSTPAPSSSGPEPAAQVPGDVPRPTPRR